MGLHRFDKQCRSAEIGYGVHPAHRRRGVALRAVTAASSYGFTALNLARISLIHATGNPGSCAVAGAAGFAFEGVERAGLDHGDGVLHDVHRHARLATDGDVSNGACPRTGRAPVTDPVTIGAGALSLRPWTEDDAEQVLAAFADPVIAAWNPRLPLSGHRRGAPVGGLAGDGLGERRLLFLGGGRLRVGRLLGSTGLRHIDPIDHGAVASYWTLARAAGAAWQPRH